MNDFDEGLDLGKGLKEIEMWKTAQKAYDDGEIELWLETVRPKTHEEWEAFNQKYGEDFYSRWITK